MVGREDGAGAVKDRPLGHWGFSAPHFERLRSCLARAVGLCRWDSGHGLFGRCVVRF